MGTQRGLADWVLTREVGGWTLPDLLDHAHQQLDVRTVTLTLSAGTAGLLAYWLWRRKQYFNTLQEKGIPCPPPSVIIGNVGQMFKLGFMTSFAVWRQDLGKVYGVYSTSGTALVVMDPEVLRELMIKKFHFFSNRVVQDMSKFRPFDKTLMQLKDDHWKHVRSQLSPAFSSGKLKKMMPAIERVLENMRRNVRNTAGQDVELKMLGQSFAMDAIAGAAFGVQVDSLANPNDPFIINGLNLLKQNPVAIVIALTFPKLFKFLMRLGLVNFVQMKSLRFFLDFLVTALKERRSEEKSYGDFLQLLVEAEREGAIGPVDKEIDHAAHLTTSKQWTRKGMREDEVEANAFIFLLAGYETTSTVLPFALFCLAAHPDVQAKAQQEVDVTLGKEAAVTYEAVSHLTYLDMCINETMRLFPPAFILDREAGEDCELGGFPVKKGMQILVPVFSVHRDPDHWTDPDTFDPDRHTPEARAERHPFAFLPFGQGPRNCIGMRLAQLEIRMAIASLLQRFTITLTDKSVYPPRFEKPETRVVAADGLWVKFLPRA